MKQINVTETAGDMLTTVSKTQLTLTIEQVLYIVENLFFTLMKEIMKQKKNIFCKESDLLEDAKKHMKQNIIPEKFGSDYTLLSTCKILLISYLWKKINEAEGEYIKEKLINNDTKFAESFFYGNSPRQMNISRLRARLKNEIQSSYALTVSEAEISTIIYRAIWDYGNWKGLKAYKKSGSIFSWIETVARHELMGELRKQKRITQEKKRTAGNTRIAKRKLTKEMTSYILTHEHFTPETHRIIEELYITKKSPKEIMEHFSWSEKEYSQNIKNVEKILKETLLRSSEDYQDLVKDKTNSHIDISLDEAMQNGYQVIFKANESNFEDIFGVNLSDEEIQDKALETIHKIEKTVEFSDRERYVWKSRFYENKSPVKLSEEMNIRRSNVDNIYLRAKKKFYKAAKEWYKKENGEKVHIIQS